jgi:plasmid stability protein
MQVMATLTIRNLPEEVHSALRRRAAENARSMEAEARDVLRRAVAAEVPTAEDRAEALAALRRYGAKLKRKLPKDWSVVDELLAERRLAAAREAGVLTSDEARNLLDRMAAFEVQPAEVKAIAEARLAPST